MSEQEEAIAGAATPVDESLSMEALIGQMSEEEAKLNEPEKPKEGDAETETNDDEVDDTPPDEEEETEEQPEEVAGIDLNKLTPEQWEEVRENLKSKAAKEFPEYRRKLREKDEQIARLLEQQAPAPKAPEAVESPLLKGVETADQLEAKAADLKKTARAIEALLDDNEDASLDEIIESGEHSYTKRQWKAALRNTRTALDEAVPYMQHQFARKGEFTMQETAFNAAAKEQVPEVFVEDSEIGKRFKAMLEDPRLGKVREHVPELAPQMTLLLAHACRSLFGSPTKTAKVVTPPGPTPKAKPPASPAGGAPAGGVKVGAEKEKRIQAAQRRYEASPTQENLVALEMAEQS